MTSTRKHPLHKYSHFRLGQSPYPINSYIPFTSIMVRLFCVFALLFAVAFAASLPCPDRPSVCCEVPGTKDPLTIPSACKCTKHRGGRVKYKGSCNSNSKSTKPEAEAPDNPYAVCCVTVDLGTFKARNKSVCQNRYSGYPVVSKKCDPDVCTAGGKPVCCKVPWLEKPLSMNGCQCDDYLYKGECKS